MSEQTFRPGGDLNREDIEAMTRKGRAWVVRPSRPVPAPGPAGAGASRNGLAVLHFVPALTTPLHRAMGPRSGARTS